MIAILLAGILAQATAAPASVTGTVEKDPLVCRTETPVGSRLPQKVCLRKSVREQMRRDSRKVLQDVQQSGDGPFKTP
jgi:hypothetical protein